jgi:hypothetical protein
LLQAILKSELALGEPGQVIGLPSEAHALRRYSDASEWQRRELPGEL